MSFLKDDKYTPSSQRGVLYFNTVPRDMRPQEVRLHFNQYGDIHRMKFIPFPKKARKPGGALLPLQYKEGWMEFTSAEDAKNAAACKNGEPVDVKRQRRCYGQLWTVRFMEDFTWDSLLEEAEGKRRARRAAEVEAQREERSINETYRRMVLQASSQKRPRPAHVQKGEGGQNEAAAGEKSGVQERHRETKAVSSAASKAAVEHKAMALTKKAAAGTVKKTKKTSQ